MTALEAKNVWVLVEKELHDARRHRWFLLFALVFAVLGLALSLLGMAGLGRLGVAGFGRTGASLVNLVLFIVPLMGLVLGAVSVAGERERGTLAYLLAQPVHPVEVLVGKFIGLDMALMAALAAGFGLSGLVIAWYGQTAHLHAFLVLLGLTLLLGWVHVSIGVLISVWTRRSATAIGVALFLWLVILFLSDLGLMGTALVLRLSPARLLGLALVNPAQVFKLAAFYTLRGNLELMGPAAMYAVRTMGPALPYLLAGILVVWLVVPFGLALVGFQKWRRV